jgi:hypothetical protein
MSIITRNQITIFEVLDGEPGPTGPQGPEGPAGPAGSRGEDGQSLFTWVAFASDIYGSHISTSYTEGLHTHIGHAYNKTTPTPDITSPTQYEWTPFYAHLIATKIQVTSDGAVYSGYSPNGEAPADGKGFYLGNGIIKAKDGEFTGTFRSGEGADTGARFAARESVGVGEIQHSGGTQNDLLTPTEGDVSVDLIEVQITQTNIQHTYQVEHVYQIGDIGPGGGYIFYDKGNWTDGWRYIETASDNWYGTNPPDMMLPLSTFSSPPTTPTYSREIGDAETNFAALKSFLGSTAAIQAVDTLTAGGKSDWVIPTGNELDLMWNRLWKQNIGVWGPAHYYATGMWRIVYFSSSLYAESGMPDATTIEAYIFDHYSEYVDTGSSRDSAGHWSAEADGTYTRPIRYVKEIPYDTFTYYQDAFKWRVNSGTWSSQQEIVSGQSYSLGYGGLSISFGSPTGHTVGETWSFSQGNLFGLSIKNSAGVEYLKAINGEFLLYGNGVLAEKTLNGYPGFVHADGTDTNYLRTPKNGIIPYSSGGDSNIGTSGWPFTQIWGNYVRGAVGNDFADFIETPPGWRYGYAHLVDGIYYGIPSDTASFFAGKEGNNKMPRAVVGFVLMYVDRPYPVNTKLTFRADGILTKKRWWLKRPVIATYYMKPKGEVWNDAAVDNRHIVKVVC